MLRVQRLTMLRVGDQSPIVHAQGSMAMKSRNIISLAAAIAALSGGTAVISTPAAARIGGSDEVAVGQNGSTAKGEPNVFMSIGNNLLGLIVTKATDGTVSAQHYSHSSHASHESHASHHSHYSSR
jgi:hypothetical protein